MIKVCINCSSTEATKWYSGPICRTCYRKSLYVYAKNNTHSRNCKHCCIEFTSSNILMKFCSLSCGNKNRYVKKEFVNSCKRCGQQSVNNREMGFCNISCYKKYRSNIVPLKFNERIKHRLRSRLWQALRSNLKTGSAVRDLGCSIQELKIHLESQFTQGMTWENYGRNGWHIDHIKPLVSYDLSNSVELKAACHYTNLQPLWAKDNLTKGAKL